MAENRTLPLAVFLLLTAGCRTETPKKDPGASPQTLGTVMTDQDGRRWDVHDPQHKLVLVEFWATTCGPCIEALPALHAMYRRFRPNGLVMLSVNTDGDQARAMRFLKGHPFPNPVILDDGAVWKAWEVTKLPTMMLVREGRVLRRWEGQTSVPEVEKAVQSLLNPERTEDRPARS